MSEPTIIRDEECNGIMTLLRLYILLTTAIFGGGELPLCWRLTNKRLANRVNGAPAHY